MRIHHVLIILTLTIIHGHTEFNHENSKRWIISENVQAMPIKLAVWIVRLHVYTIASPVTLNFIQGHKCASILTTFQLALARTIFKLLH